MFQEQLLKNKIILVTGGAGGLGRAMAIACASLGADVAICGRTQASLDEAKAEILTHAATGVRVATSQTDIRDEIAVGKMFDAIEAELGPVRGLVNNAAGNFYCPSEDLSANGFKSIVDIVLHGTFHCTQEFGKRRIAAAAPGEIVNIVTTYTQTGSAFTLPSACAKAGVMAMTTTLAWEWAEYNIRCNAIAPGPVPTKGAWKRLIPGADFEEQYKQGLPLKRFGTPEEIARVAVMLLADEMSYINGECITVDGAEHLKGGQFNFLTGLMPREKIKAVFAAMKPRS